MMLMLVAWLGCWEMINHVEDGDLGNGVKIYHQPDTSFILVMLGDVERCWVMLKDAG